MNGDVDASDITGILSIRDRFARVSAARISGAVKIMNGNGAVNLTECGGYREVKNSLEPVAVQNVRGGLIVSNTNGRIDATKSRTATLTTTFGDVAFSDMRGELPSTPQWKGAR